MKLKLEQETHNRVLAEDRLKDVKVRESNVLLMLRALTLQLTVVLTFPGCAPFKLTFIVLVVVGVDSTPSIFILGLSVR